MGKRAKIWLIVAISLVLIGFAILGGTIVMSNGKVEMYKIINHKVDSPFKDISVDVNTADVTFVSTEDQNGEY